MTDTQATDYIRWTWLKSQICSYKSAKVTFSESLDSLPRRIVFKDEMLSSMPDP